VINLKSIKKVYHTKSGNVEALKDIHLSINAGEIFGIIGYSGAGKSTLIRLINLLEQPTSGTVLVDGEDLTSLSEKKLRAARKRIGMIFQHFNLLWSRTVEENIRFPLEIAGVAKKDQTARVHELIKLVGLEGREKSYPSELSGGQKQRVGIARALANDPKVLLCDEATSALDPKTTDSILDLLVDINQKLGLTIVLITHEMNVIRKICHRVAVIDEGRIVEEGNVLDVFQHPKEAITRDFVKQVSEVKDQGEMEALIQAEHPNGEIVNLIFAGKSANRPILQKLMRQTTLDVNILQGHISQTQGGAYGTMTVLLEGEPPVVKGALEDLKKEGVQVEVIQNADNSVSKR
jgi:D-methionine transport system ATP-binding protein